VSITTNGKNAMLDALLVDYLSLHTAFPGSIGSSEVSGGAYARQAAVIGAASGGSRSLSSAVALSVPACTVAWVGLWDTSNTVFMAYSPNGGNPQEFQVDTAANAILCPAHGYSDDQTVVFYGGAVPAPLVEGTVYYVVVSTTDTFKVAATVGGASINLTAAAGSACLVSRIVLEVYGGSGTHTVSTLSIGLPN
jgi:hypothetical protein